MFPKVEDTPLIHGIDKVYQAIADGIVDEMPELWRSARIDVTFYDGLVDFDGEFVANDGVSRSFNVNVQDTIFQLRRMFIEARQPLWGQFVFLLSSAGQFDVKWGYENIDENGNTVFDERTWLKNRRERISRLASQ